MIYKVIITAEPVYEEVTVAGNSADEAAQRALTSATVRWAKNAALSVELIPDPDDPNPPPTR